MIDLIINGIRIRSSLLAVNTEQAKRHRKRRSQSASYHRRVQKKWLKRFGTKQVPCAYVIDNGFLGGVGQTLIAHPSIVERLRSEAS